MNDFRGRLDGRCFLTDSPFHSAYFVIATAVGLGAVGLDLYLLVHRWQAMNRHFAMILGALIGLQLIYQWWRTLRYYSQVRQLYSMRPEGEAKEGTPLDLALRISAGGLTDLLYYFYGTILLALVLIEGLLTHCGKVK
jgi:hypothetical protein